MMEYTSFGEAAPDDLSLRQAMANILRGLTNKQQWQDLGQGVRNAAAVVPNTAESLARGGVAQAIGAVGDLRDLNQTIKSYMPESVQNVQTGMELLSNPLAQALVVPKAPTTKQTLDFVPRVSDPYEGFEQHEELGTWIAPAMAKGVSSASKGALNASDKAVQMITGNPNATATEVIDYASKFSPVKMAQELKKNELGFYSTLDEAVNNLPQAKGTGQQYMAQLLKTPAVKQEEMVYRGLDKFLEQNPKVTKQEIQDFLHTNPVKLKETVLDDAYQGKQRVDLAEDYRLRDGEVIDDYDYIDTRADDYLDDFRNDPDIRLAERDAILMNRADEFADYDINPSTAERLEREVDDALYERAHAQAKEEYYSDPYMRYEDDYGGEITGNDSIGYFIKSADGTNITPQRGIYNLEEAEAFLRNRHLDDGNLAFEPEGGPKYADYQTEGPSKNYREVLIQLDTSQYSPQYAVALHPTIEGKFTLKSPLRDGPYLTGADGKPIVFDTEEKAIASPTFQRYRNQVVANDFESGHFDEPNILAHMRVNDRMIDGKKSLFIEEIQSDWHQQGRKKGYETPEGKQRRADIRVELGNLDNEARKLRAQRNVVSVQEEPQINARLDEINKETEALRYELHSIGDIPDAPYKKNWQEMAVRRAIQMAVDEGYDRVAFTTGKQQAERYNLAKHINDLNIARNKDNFVITATNKQGLVAINKSIPDLRNLDDYVGKEMANRIKEDFANKSGNEHNYSGLDLEVGGEGMKGFYDKILPEYINKYGKKYGIKVGKTNLPSQNNYAEYKKWAVEQDPSLNDTFLKNSWNNEDDLYQKFVDSGVKGGEVHYFDITPEAKKSLLEKGSPLFAVPPAAAMTDEESRKEMLERLFNENQK